MGGEYHYHRTTHIMLSFPVCSSMSLLVFHSWWYWFDALMATIAVAGCGVEQTLWCLTANVVRSTIIDSFPTWFDFVAIFTCFRVMPLLEFFFVLYNCQPNVHPHWSFQPSTSGQIRASNKIYWISIFLLFCFIFLGYRQERRCERMVC